MHRLQLSAWLSAEAHFDPFVWLPVILCQQNLRLP